MLRKYSNSRSLRDNIQLGVLTAFSAGMVNVASLIIFFAFTSNVTGHYAILAEEIAKGHWYQVGVVFAWILLFFMGAFVANFIIINLNKKNAYAAHALPLLLEMLCLVTVGIYGQYYYQETLTETEVLVGLMLFAMGLQNGMTASVSNFVVKTTHLTGLTTDLGILFSMFTQKEFRDNPTLVGRAKLLVSIAVSYVSAGVLSALIYHRLQFRVFFVVACVIVVIICYDYSKLRFLQLIKRRNVGKALEAKMEAIHQDQTVGQTSH
ncbi:YoaK family protein [Telluribacter humicola]|uniref:YoaK family protein n=1 Tax=Telluribacter humicola TaxID=1720261 RepID=UPI001A9564EC|nr:YoaK family protein [Telluribacter humicola]